MNPGLCRDDGQNKYTHSWLCVSDHISRQTADMIRVVYPRIIHAFFCTCREYQQFG